MFSMLHVSSFDAKQNYLCRIDLYLIRSLIPIRLSLSVFRRPYRLRTGKAEGDVPEQGGWRPQMQAQ
jgi:hypothetical protein